MELSGPPWQGNPSPDAGFLFVPYLAPSPQPRINARMVWVYYVTEGAANVLYRMVYVDEMGTHEEDARLLRLRKDKLGLPSCSVNFTFYQTRICPGSDDSRWLFPRRWLIEKSLYPQDLPHGLAETLNASLRLREQNGTRPAIRHGEYLAAYAQEKQALLVRNLRMDMPFPGHVVLEFKPKWLVQSPSAPPGSSACRNCALKHMRQAVDHAPGRGHLAICPFKLFSPRSDILQPVLNALFPALPQWHSPTFPQHFEAQFARSVLPLLERLQTTQSQYRHVGLEDLESSTSPDLVLAMTLRDCSVVMNVRIDTHDNGRAFVDFVNVTLLDLDPKLPTPFKRSKWVDTERALIQGGWYEGRGQGSPQVDSVYDCLLFRRYVV